MVLGASHHDLELSDLDRLSAGAHGLSHALVDGWSTAGGHANPIDGSAVLATCNRLEIYVDANRFHDAVDAVTAQVARKSGLDPESVAQMLKVRVGAPVAAHLFTVASGLDSMVVGEAEISGQVAKALREAQTAHTASPALNRLFQSASRTAKKVSSQTGLGKAGRSVASVALDVAAEGGTLGEGSPVLIIGTGAYARVVAAALRDRGCTDLFVYSPSGRAEAFARTHQAVSVTAAELPAVVGKVALVVACSGTTGGALTPEIVGGAHAGSGRELVIIDLALRADVSVEVRQLDGIRVIDLNTVAARSAPEQTEALIAAQDMVIAAVADFEDDLAVRTLDPAVVALRSHVAGMVEKEMVRLRGKYDESVAAELEHSMHRLTRSLLHTPTLRAQQLARSGEGAGYLSALHTLFGIDLNAPPTVSAGEASPNLDRQGHLAG